MVGTAEGSIASRARTASIRFAQPPAPTNASGQCFCICWRACSCDSCNAPLVLAILVQSRSFQSQSRLLFADIINRILVAAILSRSPCQYNAISHQQACAHLPEAQVINCASELFTKRSCALRVGCCSYSTRVLPGVTAETDARSHPLPYLHAQHLGD